MFVEKKRLSVPPRLFTANGDSNGTVTVLDTRGFFVKQRVQIQSDTLQPQEFEIKRFLSPTTFKVGPRGKSITTYSDISEFLVSDNASISAVEQDRPGITKDEHERAVYAEEPIVAKRTVSVDEFGNYYNTNNRLPVDIGATISLDGDVLVDIDAIDDLLNPDNALSVGTENGSKNGIRHVLRIDSDLDTRVGISDGPNKAEVDLLRRLSVVDTAANTTLSSILLAANSINLKTPSLGQAPMANSVPVVIASNQSTIPVSVSGDPFIISGTEDGTDTGLEFPFVNNVRLQILSAKDRIQNISYSDFGTKNQRITQIDYTAPSIGSGPGFTARKTISYTLIGTKYRRDTITWSII